MFKGVLQKMRSDKFHEILKRTSDNDTFFKTVASGSSASLIGKDSIAGFFLKDCKVYINQFRTTPCDCFVFGSAKLWVNKNKCTRSQYN